MNRLLAALAIAWGGLAGAAATAQDGGPFERGRILESLYRAWPEGVHWVPADASAAPVQGTSGLFSCAAHSKTLATHTFELPLAGGVSGARALLCPEGREAFYEVSGVGGEVRWYGPIHEAEARFRRLLVRRLARERAASEGVVYPGQFAGLADLGPGVVLALLDIVGGTRDDDLRTTALVAACDVADARAFLDLRRLAQRGFFAAMPRALAAGLRRLGDASFFEARIRELEAALAAASTDRQRGERRQEIADFHGSAGQYEAALPHWEAAESLLADDAAPAYGCACTNSRLGRIDEAFEALRRYAARGSPDAKRLLVDGDLEAVRADPRFLGFYLSLGN